VPRLRHSGKRLESLTIRSFALMLLM
jgi:hypothetical protein